jgi:ribosomal protein L11 methyltransferase
MLRVYEIKGSEPPRDPPQEGLEGIWPEPPFYYLFYRKQNYMPAIDEAPDGAVERWLASRPGWQLTSRYDLPYEKWQDVSTPRFRLGSFDIRLKAERRECDPPVHGSPGERPLRILIDPGVVFGSGLHPATQGCLLAISRVFERARIRTAVDFGAGTGILAIACALAGAEFVLAIDRNPLALQNARRNVLANGVDRRVALMEADSPGCIHISPDIFMMNLEWPILEKILEAGEWKRSRRVILAGFLPGRLESVQKLARPDFRLDGTIDREGWPTVIFRKEEMSAVHYSG